MTIYLVDVGIVAGASTYKRTRSLAEALAFAQWKCYGRDDIDFVAITRKDEVYD